MIKPKHYVIGAIVVTICLAPTLILAVREVARGHGAEIYTNVYGLAIHWTSLLIMVAFVFVVMLAALVGRLLYFWRIRRDARALDRWIDARTKTTGRQDKPNR
jgi:hypothetical protein